jgi:prophage regulatory protein
MNNIGNRPLVSSEMEAPRKLTRIVRLPEVKNLTGLSRSTLYDRMKGGSFPHTIPLGGRLVGWLESDVKTWIEGRATETRQ